MIQSVPIRSLALAPENPRKEISSESVRASGAGRPFAGRGHSPGLPVENLQREDMSPAEEVEAVAKLVDLVGLAGALCQVDRQEAGGGKGRPAEEQYG